MDPEGVVYGWGDISSQMLERSGVSREQRGSMIGGANLGDLPRIFLFKSMALRMHFKSF